MEMKKNKFIVLFSVLILSTLILNSCFTDYGLTASDYDTVVTLYDNTADFKKPEYAMPDTVIHLVEDGTSEEDIDRSKDALILSIVADNMAKLGYERVPVDTTKSAPGFVILVAVTKTDNYGAVVWPGWGYWGGWGWWGGYPGWYYPGGVTTYNYTTGTIFIDLMDPLKINPNNQAYGAVWLARLNGVLSSSFTGSTNAVTRIKERINDAFNQSPYLGAN